MPGALTGVSLIATYNTNVTWWVYDHWPVVALCYIARFAWIGALVGAVLSATQSRDLTDQALLDGATRRQAWWQIVVPPQKRLLIGAVAIVTALSLGEVPGSALVRVPGYSPIIHVIIEKFHRMEDDMLIALSLLLVAAGLPAAYLASFLLSRNRT